MGSHWKPGAVRKYLQLLSVLPTVVPPAHASLHHQLSDVRTVDKDILIAKMRPGQVCAYTCI